MRLYSTLSKHPYCLFAIAAILSLAPLWYFYLFRIVASTDMALYMFTGKEFAHQFWNGDFYPRWLMRMNAGLGAPVTLYYPPVAFLLGVIWQFPDSIDPFGYLRHVSGLTFSTFVCGVTCYWWLKRHFTRDAAILAALAYLVTPYRFFYIYLDFHLAQNWVMAFFPLAMLSVDKIIARERYAIPCLAASYALFALTHIPGTIVFAGIPILYGLVFAPKGAWFETAWKMALAAALAVGLSAIYLLPFYENLRAINNRHFLSGGFDYRNNFYMGEYILMTPLFPLLGLYIWLKRKKAETGFDTRWMYFWLAVGGVVVFLMCPISMPIWDNIAILHIVQFPSVRFQATLAIALAALFAFVFARKAWGGWLTVLVVLIYTVHFTYIVQTFHYNHFLLDETDRLDMHDFMNTFTVITQEEYMTAWMNPELSVPRYSYDSLNNPMVELVSGQGTAKILDWQPREIMLDVNIETDNAELSLRRFYFVGWRVLNEKGEELANALYPNGYYGLMQLSLPKGHQVVTLQMDSIPGEANGQYISLASLLVLLTMIGFSNYSSRANRAS